MRRTALTLSILSLVGLSAIAHTDLGTLTNTDIEKLARGGFSDDFVQQLIDGAAHRFNLLASDLAELKKAGVSDPVIAKMLRAEQGRAENVRTPLTPAAVASRNVPTT